MTKSGSNVRINLSAIVYQEDGVWMAHCLELDIVAEAESADDAVSDLVSLCDFQIKVAMEEGDLRSIFSPAPPEVWQMFSSGRERRFSGKRMSGRKNRFESPVDRFETRQLAFA